MNRLSKLLWNDCLWTDWTNPCGLIVYEQIEQTLVGWFFINTFSTPLWADWINPCGLFVSEQIEQTFVGWPDCLWTDSANRCGLIVCKSLWIKRKWKIPWNRTSLQMLKRCSNTFSAPKSIKERRFSISNHSPLVLVGEW